MSPEKLSSSSSPEVSERQDDAAERELMQDGEIQAYKEKMIASVMSLSHLPDALNFNQDDGFKESLTSVLDDVIQTGSRRLVNVEDLDDIYEKDLNIIKTEICSMMNQFKTAVVKRVEDDIVNDLELEDISGARDALGYLFDSHDYEFNKDKEFSRETKGNVDIGFSIEKDEEGVVQSATMNYSEKNGEGKKMVLVGNDRFFDSKELTKEGTLASQIKKNREVYKTRGVNYKISDALGFNKYIKAQLKVAPGKLSLEEAMMAAVDIVQKKIDPSPPDVSSLGPLKSDTIPIDKLIMEGGEGVCRHYTAATITVFEEIQAIAKNAGNNSLEGVVAFENIMVDLQHGAVAFAKGNEITTMDVYWDDDPNCKDPLDATFNPKQGTLTGLYFTLSMVPKGRPEGRIFDMDGFGTMINSSIRDLQIKDGSVEDGDKDKDIKMIDNDCQRYIMQASEFINRPSSRQNIGAMCAVAANIGMISKDLMKVSYQSMSKNYFHRINEISIELHALMQKKIEDGLGVQDFLQDDGDIQEAKQRFKEFLEDKQSLKIFGIEGTAAKIGSEGNHLPSSFYVNILETEDLCESDKNTSLRLLCYSTVLSFKAAVNFTVRLKSGQFAIKDGDHDTAENLIATAFENLQCYNGFVRKLDDPIVGIEKKIVDIVVEQISALKQYLFKKFPNGSSIVELLIAESSYVV